MATAPTPTSTQSQSQHAEPRANPKSEAALGAVSAVRDRLRKLLATAGRSLDADTLEAVTASADELDALLPDSPHVGPKAKDL